MSDLFRFLLASRLLRRWFSLPLNRRSWLVPLLVLVWLLPLVTHAQIVDDSTKVLYGPKTTFIIREADVLRDTITPVMIDTTLTRLPQQRYWLHDSTFQQDLGNLGTATRPLLWQTNTQLGNRLGRNVFDKYAINPATIPYYDTRSPYSYFQFNSGSTGESTFRLSYSRSVKKYFNVGAVYERFTSTRTVGDPTGRQDLVRHTNVLVFMRYQSPNDRYHGLFNVTTSRHRAIEQGGIRRDSDPVAADSLVGNGLLFIQPSTQSTWLQTSAGGATAANEEERNNVHLAHTYRLLGQGLTAFHVLDYSSQRNRFYDNGIVRVGGRPEYPGYPNTFLNLTKTNDIASYHQVENTLGFLGTTTWKGSLVEYRVYARRRDISLRLESLFSTVTGTDSAGRSPQLPLLSTTTPADARKLTPLDVYRGEGKSIAGQVFVGGNAAFNYKQFAIQAEGEYLILNDEYKFRGQAKLGPLTGELLLVRYSPTLTQQLFSGNHFQWEYRPKKGDSTLDNTNVQQFSAYFSQKLGSHQFNASGALINITSLVYYGTDGRPRNAENAQQLVTLTARHRFNYGKVHFDNQGTFTLGGQGTGDDDPIRIPELVSLSRVYYQNEIFRKALFGQIGAEMYYQSSYRAYQYSPSTQQFYLQNSFTIRNYPVINVFLAADVKTVGVFVKVAYLNQGLAGNGYFTTPYYTAQQRRIQFGIRWQFFN
ncbi:putative porin [Hymenobacter aerilatus]|uniref:Putative porin n=1 Tax=Hymenobacter aerilatus TaxID=2932251 RepID=A0A8T9T3L1_9BACT|nr:putative porin [Hymenobacter aerilatus]UOR06696.1 putative porin [Hymenobacter aerilatus]